MKYLKIYENFMDSINSIAGDEEADMMKIDQIFPDNEEGLESSQFEADGIVSAWKEKFEDRTPSEQEKYDLYADLREEGFDGGLLLKTFDELCSTEGTSDLTDAECVGCNCTPCECTTGECCPKCGCDNCICDDECCPDCGCTPCEC